ncbi:MAG TPA: hypothetical protein VGB87_11025 [Vicinamibacteria bacterium]
MTDDTASCRAWAQESKVAWEVTPLIEMEKGVPVQVGFELNLFARVPTGDPSGPGREAAVEALWDRMRGIAESLLPLAGSDARIEVDPFEAAARLRPETQFAPEVLLSARLFHGPDLLAPVKPGDRERLKPLEDRLHELGLRPRSW